MASRIDPGVPGGGEHPQETHVQILIVDDSATIRAGLRRTLEKMGHQVTEAADGERALACYSNALPDLVLIDVIMPVMDLSLIHI